MVNFYKIEDSIVIIYLPIEGHFNVVEVKIDLIDLPLISAVQFWFCTLKGYAKGWHEGKNINMHRLIMSCPKELVVDHINHDTLDNRRINLRNCTARENSQNRTVLVKELFPDVV